VLLNPTAGSNWTGARITSRWPGPPAPSAAARPPSQANTQQAARARAPLKRQPAGMPHARDSSLLDNPGGEQTDAAVPDYLSPQTWDELLADERAAQRPWRKVGLAAGLCLLGAVLLTVGLILWYNGQDGAGSSELGSPCWLQMWRHANLAARRGASGSSPRGSAGLRACTHQDTEPAPPLPPLCRHCPAGSGVGHLHPRVLSHADRVPGVAWRGGLLPQRHP